MCTACHGNKARAQTVDSFWNAQRFADVGEFYRVHSETRAFTSGRYYSRKRCIRVWEDHEQPALPQPIRDPFEQSTFDACLLSCWIFTAEYFQLGTEKSEVKAYSRDCGVLKSVESSNEVCMEI